MATFKIEALTVDGERILFDDARLVTVDGTTEAVGWEVRVDGAHLLRANERQRVHLRLGSPEAGVFEGEASVASGGNRGSGATYSGVRYEGLSSLHRA